MLAGVLVVVHTVSLLVTSPLRPRRGGRSLWCVAISFQIVDKLMSISLVKTSFQVENGDEITISCYDGTINNAASDAVLAERKVG